ncbi:MAG: nitrate/nitrite transporter [Haloferacaceae archaeon]
MSVDFSERVGAVGRSVATNRALVGTLVGLWLLTAATHHYVVAPASVLPQVAADLGVSSGRAVWLVSAVPASWAATNFALGVWIDRAGDHRTIAVGTLVVSVAGVWSVVAARGGSFWSLLAARLVAGVAVGLIWTASTNLVGGAVAPTNRGTAIGFFLTSAPAGFALGQLTGPLVASRAGWPASLLVMVVLALPSFALVTVSVRRLSLDPPEDTGVRAGVSGVLRHPAVWYGCVMAFAAYSYYLFLNSWLPTYLAREFTVSPAVGGALAAVFPAMGVLSRVGGGALSDRLLGGRRVPVLRAAFLVSLPTVAAVAWTRRLAVVVGALVVAGFVIQLTFGVVYSYVREAVDPSVTGTALAFLTTAGISGAFTAPLLSGALIEWSGDYAAAFAYAAVLVALGLVLSWAAPESAAAS